MFAKVKVYHSLLERRPGACQTHSTVASDESLIEANCGDNSDEVSDSSEE